MGHTIEIMILESIVTTVDKKGVVNIAPMGPEVDVHLTRFVLKPFRDSTTFQNLTTTGCAVIHVTDDVEIFARTAIGKLSGNNHTLPLSDRFAKLIDCCRWFAVETLDWSDDPITGTQPRPSVTCRMVHQGEQRPMFGFCRAKHAVIEAAILATRVQWLGREEVVRQMESLETLVEKTGGVSEHYAWRLLQEHVNG